MLSSAYERRDGCLFVFSLLSVCIYVWDWARGSACVCIVGLLVFKCVSVRYHVLVPGLRL